MWWFCVFLLCCFFFFFFFFFFFLLLFSFFPLPLFPSSSPLFSIRTISLLFIRKRATALLLLYHSCHVRSDNGIFFFYYFFQSIYFCRKMDSIRFISITRTSTAFALYASAPPPPVFEPHCSQDNTNLDCLSHILSPETLHVLNVWHFPPTRPTPPHPLSGYQSQNCRLSSGTVLSSSIENAKGLNLHPLLSSHFH